MRKRWICLALALCLGPALFAQETLPPGAPAGAQVPKRHVIDESRIFASEPQRLALMEERLRQVEEQYQFPIYFVIYDSLIDGNVYERSQELQDQWIGEDNPGWVAVFETDSGKVSFGVHPVKMEEAPTGAMIPAPGPEDFSMLEQNGMVQTVQDRTAKITEPRSRSETVVNALADEVGSTLAARRAEPSHTPQMRTLVFGVGLAAAAGLITLLSLAWLRRMDQRARQRFIFPHVTVGTRLGAPYGGGNISSRSFSE